MTKQTLTSIERAKQRKARAERELALARQAQRSAETRAKIILGGALLAVVRADPEKARATARQVFACVAKRDRAEAWVALEAAGLTAAQEPDQIRRTDAPDPTADGGAA